MLLVRVGRFGEQKQAALDSSVVTIDYDMPALSNYPRKKISELFIPKFIPMRLKERRERNRADMAVCSRHTWWTAESKKADTITEID